MNHLIKPFMRLVFIYALAVALQNCQSEDNDPKTSEPELTIKSISPDKGTVGTVVTITGTGFDADMNNNKVEINGKICSVTTAGITQLTISIPADAGNGKIRVTVNEKSVESSVIFTFIAPSTGNTICTPDPLFGTNGIAITEVEGVTQGDFSFVHNNAVQPDGKIIVIGEYSSGKRPFAIVRYLANGTLDTSWGGDGQVTTNFNVAGGTYEYARPYAVTIQTDGKIVVAGDAKPLSLPEAFAIVRYMPDGTLDNTFSDDGILVYTPSTATNGAGALGLAIQNDGRIVVSGYATMFGKSRACVIRLLSNGTLDQNFDSKAADLQFATNEYQLLTDVKVQPDGKIVGTGSAEANFKSVGVMVRLNADGTLDNTFGSNGKVVTQVGTSQNRPSELELQSDGKILVGGYTQNGGGVLDAPASLLIRYNADGTLDQSFGTGGSVRDSNMSMVNGMVVLSSGKILTCAGGLITRYNTDGSRDNTLCNGSFFIKNSDQHASAEAMSIQGDNAVIVSGGYITETPAGQKDQRFYSARYLTQ